jgi:uncharacterized protein
LQKYEGEILFSASDIVNFLECEHLTSLDLIDLETPLPRTEDDDESRLIKAKGISHEAEFVEVLKSRHDSFIDITQKCSDLREMVRETLDAMRSGIEIIYQASLKDGNFVGHADFLRRVPLPSKLGDFGYEVLDTKLSRKTKAKFVIQLAFYSALLARVQGTLPRMMHVVLGDRTEKGFSYADYSRYFMTLAQRFLARARTGPDTDSYPVPCTYCDLCRWRDLCEEKRLKDDHLCQVANITKIQMKKLQAEGVTTLQALAELPSGTRVPKIAVPILERLISQAALQLKARLTGHNQLEILPLEEKRGFARMPCPAEGDLFFDMEGDPLEEEGLEYLFGLYFIDNGKARYKSFWAHSRREEKKAFEEFMDFVTSHLNTHPEAHIYHYAHYEETALKKLMSLHGTREAEVDNLLRRGKLIDLYKIVRESIRVSEPSYSIKNIERFYLGDRSGEIKNAGASLVYYERWKETGNSQLLKNIEQYNHEDVRSTYELRQWLLTLSPPELPWLNDFDGEKAIIGLGELTDSEIRLILYREKLVDTLPTDRRKWTQSDRLRELTYQLLDFHRRADKPVWWAMFSRREMTEEELIEDIECIGGLSLNKKKPPRQEKRSVVYFCFFPEQETKVKTGDNAVCIETAGRVNDLTVDEFSREVTFKYSSRNESLPERFSIGPTGPISSKVITDALFRFADSMIDQDRKYPAVEAILARALPEIKNHKPGDPVIDESLDLLPQVIRSVAGLVQSYLFIQGPPGSGKTYTGTHVIVELLKKGHIVGVSSNSHKAINHLLKGVEEIALADNFSFKGAKKSSRDKPDSLLDGEIIEDVFSNEDVFAGEYQLIAGTAWLLARPELERHLDFLFVDEAGQVSLANLLAIGTSARNIVLLGDQMQLGQPIQGVHPGRSGESSLEYLLDGKATISPERGVFLKKTWRMHPDVCRFISDAVYDGRLEPESHNARQTLILGPDAHPSLASTGLRFVPVEHDACSQCSQEEADFVKELFQSLLVQHFLDKEGTKHPLTLDNILVVAPYNMQVNLLKKNLPDGARVGTVDKFQGQEAEVVIVSMATSSGEYLPRFISFLYSKNRLNVAISRAKCLSLLIANPALMAIKCSKPEDMALVNTLCWVKEYSSRFETK